MTVTFISDGRVGRMVAIRALTLLMTATVFEPDCFLMPTESDCTPFSVIADEASTPPSTTRPMSLNLIGNPFRVAITMSLKSETFVSLLIVRNPTVFAPSTSVPPGSS